MVIQAAEEFSEEVGVPAGLKGLALDAVLALLLLEPGQGDAAEPAEVLRGTAGPRPVEILAGADLRGAVGRRPVVGGGAPPYIHRGVAWPPLNRAPHAGTPP